MTRRWRLQEAYIRRESSSSVLRGWRDRSTTLRDLANDVRNPVFEDVRKIMKASANAWDGAESRAPAQEIDIRTLLAMRERMRYLDPAPCRPWSGRWSCGKALSDSSQETAGNFVCWRALCPWCWMRRYTGARRMLLANQNETVKDGFGRDVQAVGVPLPWRVTKYEAAPGMTPEDRSRFEAAVKGLWRNRPQHEGRIGVPEFIWGLCLRSLWVCRDGIGFTAAVVHGSPLAGSDDDVIVDGLRMIRREFTAPDEALRWAYPYPAALLDLPPREFRALTTGPLRRRRGYERIECLPATATSWSDSSRRSCEDCR